ncbi:MAG: hypothetical protein HQ582_12225, partial [Planctomycetes bacterium]|nr:hypothetical protein [Planctomycetota bacterium]
MLLLATTIGSMIAAGSFSELAREKQEESDAANEARGLAEDRENEASEARDAAEKAEDDAYEARDQARRGQRDAELSRQRAEELVETSEQKAYAGEMTVASGFANQHNGMGRVRALVDAWIPKAGKTDRRNWEWYYMKGLAHRGIARLAVRGKAVEVTWDSRSKAVLVVDRNGRIQSHDVATGRIDVLVESPEEIQGAAAWNEDRTLVAAACVDGKIRVWDVTTTELLADLDVGEGNVTGVAWHPNGQWLAATTNKGDAIVWDWHKREIIRRLDVDGLRKDCASWHPKKPLLAVSSGNEVVVTNVTSGEVPCRLSSGRLSSLRWNPDGRRIAAASGTRIHIWDTERQEMVATLTGYPEYIAGLAWDPKGNQLAAAPADGTVRVRDAKDRKTIHVLRGHEHNVEHVAWSPDGRFLVSNGWDGYMCVWDAVKGTDDLIHPLGRGCCRWLPHPDQIAVAVDRTLEILNATTGQADESWTVEFPISSFAFDSTAKRVAYRSHNGRVWISERGESSERVVLDEGKENAYVDTVKMQGVAWSPDDSLIAALTPDNQTAVWDASTGSLVATPRRPPKRVLGMAWSPDGQMLAYGGDAGELAFWDAKNRSDLRSVKVDGHVIGIHWKSDGTELLRTGGQGIDVIDPNSGRRIRKIVGPASGTKCVTATRDGSRIATTSGDGAITIWDGTTESVVASFQVHPARADWVGWNRDETRLASLASSDALRVCDAQIGLEQARDPRALSRITRGPKDGSMSAGRIRVLHEIASQHARPDDVIPTLEDAYSHNPNDGRLAFMLADLLHGRAELQRSASRSEEAEKDDERAGALFKQIVEAHPDNEEYLDADTDFQIDRLEPWSILRPTEMTSEGIERLDLLPDGSVLASAPPRQDESYAITAPCPLSHVTAIRLEALLHPSLHEGGPGRTREFRLGDIRVEAAEESEERSFAEVPISEVTVDVNCPGSEIDGRAGENESGIRGSWYGYAREGARVAIIRLDPTRLPATPSALRIKLEFSTSFGWAALGRVRFAVTDSASTGETLVRQGRLRNLRGKAAIRRAALLWHLKQPGESLATITAAEPFRSSADHFLAALVNYESGKDEPARIHLENAVTTHTGWGTMPAECLFGMAALRQGAERGHNSVRHRFLYAHMLSQSGKSDQAIEELKKLIEEDNVEWRTF